MENFLITYDEIVYLLLGFSLVEKCSDLLVAWELFRFVDVILGWQNAALLCSSAFSVTFCNVCGEECGKH